MAQKGKRGTVSLKTGGGKKIAIKTGFSELRDETRYGVFSIIFFVAALFFLLAATGKAGVAGTALFNLMERLFGIGYFLLPIILTLLAISFLRSVRPNFVASNFFGAFFLCPEWKSGFLSLRVRRRCLRPP